MLDDKRTYNRLAKPYNICKHKTAVFVHDADTSLDGFDLVLQPVDVGWQISLNLLPERHVDYVSKLDLQEFYVLLVWAERLFFCCILFIFFYLFGDGSLLQYLFEKLFVPGL